MFKILIVEDNQSFRKSLKEALDGNFSRMTIEEAVNGKEVLRKADSFRPDLVFMDIRLPDGSGLELTKEIKAQYPEVIVAMLSGHDAPEYREAAIRYGASGFLVKGTASKHDVQATVKSFIHDEGCERSLSITRDLKHGSQANPEVAHTVAKNFETFYQDLVHIAEDIENDK